MSCVSAVCITILLFAGHVYFLHSPGFLSMFLSVTMLFDIAITRTYFSRHGLATLGKVHATITAIKLALVILEEVSKRSLIRVEELRSSLGHEAVAGFWNRSIFFWVNSTLLIGFRSKITQSSLGNIGPQFGSERLQADFRRLWENGDDHKSKHALLLACLYTVPWLFIFIIPPPIVLYWIFLCATVLAAGSGESCIPTSSRPSCRQRTHRRSGAHFLLQRSKKLGTLRTCTH